MLPSDPKIQVLVTKDELRQLIEESVKQTLKTLGMATDDVMESQKDFQQLRIWRETAEEMKRKSLLALIGIAASGLAGAVWVGIKEMLTGK